MSKPLIPLNPPFKGIQPEFWHPGRFALFSLVWNTRYFGPGRHNASLRARWLRECRGYGMVLDGTMKFIFHFQDRSVSYIYYIILYYIILYYIILHYIIVYYIILYYIILYYIILYYIVLYYIILYYIILYYICIILYYIV